MILSDESIKAALASGELEIDPKPSDEQYQTSAVNIHLGDSFRIWDAAKLAVKGTEVRLDLAEQSFQATANAYAIEATREADRSVILPPFSAKPTVLLCLTRERIHLKKESGLCARVEGRSSLARYGLVVHLTAPTIHAGFNAPITLELINYGLFYFKLVPNKTMICQFIIERLDKPSAGQVSASFQGQSTPIGQRPSSN